MTNNISTKSTAKEVLIRRLINFGVAPTAPVKVSVVMPIYNVEKYLEKCLDSVINQTLKEIEIICVNDGSTDSSMDILESYAAKDPRVKIIDKENAGYGNSMNIGIANAQGEYIGIVESDDFVESNMFEILYNKAVKNKAEVVKSNFWLYWSDPEKNKLFEYFRREECGKVIVPREHPSFYNRKPSIWSAIYNRQFLLDNNIDFLETPGASFQDTSFTFKMYSCASRMLCVYEAFLHYRQDNENSSVNNADKKAFCVCDEYQEIEKFVTENKDLDLGPIYAAAFYDTCIWMYERLSPKMCYPFLQTISPWLDRLIDEVGLENIDFGDCWWKTRDIQRIANNPYEYHMWRNVERYEQEHGSFTYKTPITPLNNYHDLMKKRELEEAPLFSVIVPVYNSEKYLATSLESLLYQDFQDVEFLCINDGSTDNSLSVLEEYAAIDSRFCVVNKENGGPSSARNIGINLARGKYILFLDSDDYYSENAFEILQEAVENDPEAVIFGSNAFPAVPRPSEWLVKTLTTPDTFFEQIDSKTLLTTDYLRVYSWRCCFLKEALFNNGLRFNGSYTWGEDALFFYEALIKLRGIKVISDVVYNYRHVRQDSLMNQITRNWAKYADVQCDILSMLLKISFSNGIKPSLELLEYSCDFIYNSIKNCPVRHLRKSTKRFVKLIRSSGLERFVPEASENCRGFWKYCLDEVRGKIRHKEKLWKRIRHFGARILPPSRRMFHDNARCIMDVLNNQSRMIEQLMRDNGAMNDKVNKMMKKINKLENKDE